jgi:hypothetical protein
MLSRSIETWLNKSEYMWSLDDKKPIASVTIDPGSQAAG